MKSETFYNFLQKSFTIVESIVLDIFKTWLNTQIGQGFLKRYVNWLVDHGYEETLQPVFETLLVRAGYKKDVRDGKIFIERLKEADNAEDYDSTVDDILN